MDNVIFYFICYLLGAVSIGIMAFYHSSLAPMILSCGVNGFFYGAYGPILIEVVCITHGSENFSLTYSYLMVFMAIGNLLGGPAMGKILLIIWTDFDLAT